MSLTVNSNLNSLTTQNAISSNQQGLSTAMQRLSTGLKINSAADNAAGYAIATRMNAQISGTNQAASNANDAISLTQTAQGDLGSITGDLQQIRTLAVQAANGSNSASDRAALNNQAQQLISEITRVANSSSFNGVNLLNGSFSAQSFQVSAGTGAASTITIGSIANATASSLGVVANAVASTTVGNTATAGGLAAGDLTLNGIQVGGTVVGSNPGQATNSAIQIAAAINLVSAQSGVTATANATTLTGVAATEFKAISSVPNLTVNGIQVGNISAGGTAAGQGANVAAAINLVSNQSGVTATANSATGAVTLTASDGSDVALGNGFTATNSGLTGYTSTSTVTNTTVGAVATTFAAIAASTFTINGTNIGAVSAGTSLISQGANVASAINALSNTTGVTATASSTGAVSLFNTSGAAITVGGTITNTGLTAATTAAANGTAVPTTHGVIAANTAGLTINGVQVGAIADGGTVNGQAATTVAAINLVSSQSGVSATLNSAGTGLVLSNASGGGITIGAGFTTASTGISSAQNLASTATSGTLSLASNSGATITVGGNASASAGFATTGLQITSSTTSTLNNVSLSTATGATSALAVIDGALNMVTTSAAELGAYQNRFTQTVSALNSENVNNTASRSRITDADFALETANLSRAQVLQQAGTAMLAQANQSAQGVLSLLR